MTGKVYLVGAGPGDPELLTLKGKRVLGEAGAVLFDHLASEELLTLAPADAERVYVGKKKSDHAFSQEEICAMLIERALAGKIVVRLKGGDPYIFGRGGEEVEALAGAGIPFEVVPGVTAPLGIAAYCGVPLTHREHTSVVTMFTGHDVERIERQRLEVRRPGDGHEAEEDEHEDLAHRPVAVRERPARVRERGDHGEHPDREEHPAAHEDQVQAHQARETDGDRDRDLQLALRDQAGRRDPQRALSIGRVRAAPEVREVVREVGEDLEQQRDREAGEGCVQPERRARRERGAQAHGDAGPGRGQRVRPGGEDPGADGRRPGGSLRGSHRHQGRRGYLR